MAVYFPESINAIMDLTVIVISAEASRGKQPEEYVPCL
jgi:hypothetical protein